MTRKRRKQRVTRIRIFAVAVLGIVIAAAVLIGLFRIRSVEILGSERHGAEEIKNDLIVNAKARFGINTNMVNNEKIYNRLRHRHGRYYRRTGVVVG